MSRWPEPLARAYATCEALARSHYEDFPVASRLLPKAMRPDTGSGCAHGCGRGGIAGAGGPAPADRLPPRDCWQRRLHAAAADDASASGPYGCERASHEAVVTATARSLRTLDLSMTLFDDL